MIRRLLIIVSTLSFLAGMAVFAWSNPVPAPTFFNEFQIAPIPRVEFHPFPTRNVDPISLTGWTLTTSLGTATILPGHTIDTLHYTVIDPDSVSGTFQMNPVADSIVLRGPSGQLAERISWPNREGLPGPSPGQSSQRLCYIQYPYIDPCTGEPDPWRTGYEQYWHNDASPTFGRANENRPLGGIGGYVRRVGGRGVGNAVVRACGDSGFATRTTLSCDTSNSRTGSYSTGTPPGTYRVWAVAAGYDSAVYPQPVEVLANQITQVDIYLSSSGIEIPNLALPSPNPPALELNALNPARGTIVVTYSLSAQTRATLVVYGLNGRKMRTLLDENRGAGRHSLIWDGKNESGHSLSSGNYFLRLDAGDRTVVRRITLLN